MQGAVSALVCGERVLSWGSIAAVILTSKEHVLCFLVLCISSLGLVLFQFMLTGQIGTVRGSDLLRIRVQEGKSSFGFPWSWVTAAQLGSSTLWQVGALPTCNPQCVLKDNLRLGSRAHVFPLCLCLKAAAGCAWM